MSTHDLCFSAKKKNIYPCKPQFYYIKVGCKGVYIKWTCYHDDSVYKVTTLVSSVTLVTLTSGENQNLSHKKQTGVNLTLIFVQNMLK